jgi:glycosyltransferase involved in cell wall biosynthesis
MKLLMLGWELPPYNSGGLGVACFHMARALANKGVSVDFVLPYKAQHPKTEFMNVLAAAEVPPLVDENGEYVAFGSYSGTCTWCASRTCRHARAYGRTLVEATRKYAAAVGRLARRSQPDVIHANDWLTIEAGVRAKRATGKPLIVHVHATEFDRAGGHYGNPLIHEIEYNGLMMADRIIAISHIIKNLLVREYHIPADKIEVVHNSLDVDELSKIVVATNNYVYARTLKDLGHVIVASLGRLTVQKGLTYLLEAAALALSRNPPMLFLVAGSGEQRDQLISLAADLGISDKVIFTGFVRGERWRELYEIADIFVMPSVSEPFGLTALEAAAYDNAILLSKQSGAGEVLDNIMRFDYWDTRRLADQLINISLSPGLNRELRDNVAAEISRFSWADAAERYLEQYYRASGRRATA